ncbi:MAG: hypothetical protein H0X29_12095, partial [Parachlamydiaceae bacterium]|nr:hypothetical protein [Parachlamydiaceae bacterium]
MSIPRDSISSSSASSFNYHPLDEPVLRSSISGSISAQRGDRSSSESQSQVKSNQVAIENLHVEHNQKPSLWGKRAAIAFAGAVLVGPVAVVAVAISPIAVLVLLGKKVINLVEEREIKQIQSNVTVKLNNYSISSENRYLQHYYAQTHNKMGISAHALTTRYTTATQISPREEGNDKLLSLISAYNNCLENNNKTRSKDHVTKEEECFKKIDEITLGNKGIMKSLSNDDLKKIEKILKRSALEVAGVSEENFKLEYHKARGSHTPTILLNNLEGSLSEKTERLSNTSSIKYLELRSPENFGAQISFMKENKDILLVSELKGAKYIEGNGINAHKHTLNKGNESVSVFRSGAFAVHGRDKERTKELLMKRDNLKKSLKAKENVIITATTTSPNPSIKNRAIKEKEKIKEELVELDQQLIGVKKGKNLGIDSLQKKLNEYTKEQDLEAVEARVDAAIKDDPLGLRVGISKEQLIKEAIDSSNHRMRKELGFNDIKELQKEITQRRDFCISQALPELMASIKESASDQNALQIAIATGSFLHVTEGLLSHLNGAERGMIEDMKGTLDYLSKNCIIEFAGEPKAGQNNEVGIEVQEDTDKNPKIILKLP